MAKKGYTSEQKIENYLLQDIHSSFSTQIDSWIEGVEKIIDKITGRNFIADTKASARLYDGDGSTELLIDEAIAVTKVEVGDDSYGANFTEVASSGADRFFLKPDNYAAKELPIHKIILNARMFTNGIQNNRVTAKWGYSAAVPADIEFAATALVSMIINSQRKDSKEIKSEKIGNYSVSYSTEQEKNDIDTVKEILEKYTKINI